MITSGMFEAREEMLAIGPDNLDDASVREIQARYALTDEQVDDLIGDIGAMAFAFGDVPGDAPTTINRGEIDAALDSIGDYQ